MLPDEDFAPIPAAEDLGAQFLLLNKRIDAADFQKELRERRAMLEAARAYYSGHHLKPLKTRPGDKDPNVIINYCRKLVEASVAWLFGDNESGEMLKMELEEGELAEAPADADDDEDAAPAPGGQDRPRAEAEAWLHEVWEANGGAQFLQKVGRRTSITGHGFVKVLPGDDPANGLEGLPKLVLQKPEIVSVLRQQDDTDEAEAYVIQWAEKRLSGTRLREVKVRQIIARLLPTPRPWVYATFEDTGRSGELRWQAVAGPEVWPYTWCPIVEWQNLANEDGYYGLSDLEDLTTINDAINFAVSNINRILYIHGHPRTVGTGFEAGDVEDTAIDSFWTIPNKEAKVQNLEMQSDLAAAYNFIQYLGQALFTIGRDLDMGTLREKIGQITNFGLRVLANLALSKLGEKRLNYGRAIIEINRILLELGGFPVQDTKLHWRNPLPEDEKEEVERLKVEREIGIVSKQSAAEERGRDWDTEKDRMADESADEENLGGRLLEAFERGGQVSPLRRGPAPGNGRAGGEA